MNDDVIEKFAMKIALGNNGGQWSSHYTDKQKEYWRQFIRDLIEEIKKND